MDKNTASDMINAIMSLDEGYNKLLALANNLEDDKEKKYVFDLLRQGMAAIDIHLLLHIVKQYPDIDPDKKVLEKIQKEHEEKQ